ncbi:hypothetical protein CR513_50242, partial [Mucuna pruriens]
MFRVLISWGHSQSPMATHIFCWSLTTFQDGPTFFFWFGVPKALISDQGSHFCNKAMASLLHKYGVVHRVAIVYHTQTNGQAEVFNREIKKTLQKMTNPSRKD